MVNRSVVRPYTETIKGVESADPRQDTETPTTPELYWVMEGTRRE